MPSLVLARVNNNNEDDSEVSMPMITSENGIEEDIPDMLLKR